MSEQTAWSISLGRWAGVQVRLHAFFFASAIFTLYLAWLHGQSQNDHTLFWLGLAGTGILLVGVILHEIGHVATARHFGGRADLMVLGPWGGLESSQPPWEPKHQLAVYLAGPLVNLLLCLLLAPLVVLACGESPLELMHPLNPVPMTTGPAWQVAIKMSFWINWLLLLVNLIPAFPFDGGRAFVAAIQTFSPGTSLQKATSTVVGVAYVGALLLGILAIFSFTSSSVSMVPTWLPLLLLALFLFFSAQQHSVEDDYDIEEEEKELFGYDFSQGYASLENSVEQQQPPPPPAQGAIARWLQRRREERKRRQQQIEQEEDSRLDAILARLHEKGMEGLTTEEQALLKRASARYRSRLGS